MVARADREDIWNWYQIILKYQAQDLPPKKFCEANGLEYKQFCNKLFRIIWKRDREPELYKKCLPLTRKFMEGDMPPHKFVKIHDISLKLLSEMATHLRYNDIIDEMRAIKEPESMKFVQVPTMNLPMPTPEPQQEILKKQNDLELIISKGVRVVVAPEVGADKLIRIIELLKDL